MDASLYTNPESLDNLTTYITGDTLYHYSPGFDV